MTGADVWPATSTLPPVSIPETLSGRAGIVDLWTFASSPDEPSGDAAAWDRLLAPEERARRDRFRFDRDRRVFAASRVLLRTALSRYAGVAAHAWAFTADARGRPSIASPAVAPPLHFSLSHARELVACVVSVAHAGLGVDVEPFDGDRDELPLAERLFSAPEVEALGALEGTARRDRFLAVWTLKESHGKARGLGLGVPLDETTFTLAEGAGVRASFAASSGDDAARWRFALFAAAPRHVLAVAVETGGAELSLRHHRLAAPPP